MLKVWLTVSSLSLGAMAALGAQDSRLSSLKQIRDDHDDCENCREAKYVLNLRCGEPPTDNTLVETFLRCICNLNDDFFDEYSDCIEDCRSYTYYEPTRDDDQLRRHYCNLADNVSPVLEAIEASASTVPGLLQWRYATSATDTQPQTTRGSSSETSGASGRTSSGASQQTSATITVTTTTSSAQPSSQPTTQNSAPGMKTNLWGLAILALL
ncbi:uncharacterized protein LODBEIA_P60640 [Lodderomyces beijingensis]|uniref:Extracellular membrane protein CFEM domain-containing protein n=1 Tax=Lodderomyces beijingensis TaxID=1775926 RepID=A0ABP0ZW40_9ASCO